MTDKEIKNNLIEIILAMAERSEDINDPFTELNMNIDIDDYIINVTLNYEIISKEEVKE